MVGGLFEVDGDASDGSFHGLSEDGVEGFVDFGFAGEHEHEGGCYVFDLFWDFDCFYCFGHEGGDEAEYFGEAFEG